MASQEVDAWPILTLKAVANRLSTTPTDQLPRIVPLLSTQLIDAKPLLSSAQSHSEASAACHQFRTRVTSLLQDRSPQGRYAGVVLVKTAIDLGGWEVLHQSAPWARFLTAILNKQDPLITRKLCMMTLVRIFNHTQAHPNLVREITTQNLPAFITACRSLLRQWPAGTISKSLVDSIFFSFSRLLPRHPAIFRPFVAELQSLIASITGIPTKAAQVGGRTYTGCNDAPTRLYVALHVSATKAGEDRDAGLLKILHATEQAIATTFSHVLGEDYKTRVVTLGMNPSVSPIPSVDDIARQLSLIKAYITVPTMKTVNLPVGRIVRLLSAIPTVQDSNGNNNALSRRERDQFLLDIPHVQIQAMQIWIAVLQRLGKAATPFAFEILDFSIKSLSRSPNNVALRTTAFVAVEQVMCLLGPIMGKTEVSQLSVIIKQCCADLTPTGSAVGSQPQTTSKAPGKSLINPEAIIGESAQNQTSTLHCPGLQSAASKLIETILANIPPSSLSESLRSKIDRIAILTRNEPTLLRSILNPAPQNPSLLPFLARQSPGESAITGVLRPQVPPLKSIPAESWPEEAIEPEASQADTYEEPSFDSSRPSAALPEQSEHTSSHDTHRSPPSLKRTNEDDRPSDPAKRLRFDISQQPSSIDLPPTTIDPPIQQIDESIASAPPSGLAKHEVQSDSEDDSDIEIPELVLRTGAEDDSE